jgi:hypothetical protein
MSYKIIDTLLGSAVANDATFTVSYPTGTNAGSFKGAVGHKMMLGTALLSAPADFTLTFGTADITVTNKSGSTWASGERAYLEIQTVGDDYIEGVNRTVPATIAYVELGAPDTADGDGVAASQAVTVATTPLAVIDGALADDGVATFDVPRNVVAAWTGTAVLTITGTDEYGDTVVESSASGTSMTGKKAFKSVSSASFSANVTAATIGTGDVLGLPLFVQDGDFIIKEVQDDAAATAGTAVGGDTAEPTATSGDVRGTYDPNAACDGSKAFRLAVIVTDPTYKGQAQYAG